MILCHCVIYIFHYRTQSSFKVTLAYEYHLTKLMNKKNIFIFSLLLHRLRVYLFLIFQLSKLPLFQTIIAFFCQDRSLQTYCTTASSRKKLLFVFTELYIPQKSKTLSVIWKLYHTLNIHPNNQCSSKHFKHQGIIHKEYIKE